MFTCLHAVIYNFAFCEKQHVYFAFDTLKRNSIFISANVRLILSNVITYLTIDVERDISTGFKTNSIRQQ